MGNTNCKNILNENNDNRNPHTPWFKYANVPINGTFVHPYYCGFNKCNITTCQIDVEYTGGWNPQTVIKHTNEKESLGSSLVDSFDPSARCSHNSLINLTSKSLNSAYAHDMINHETPDVNCGTQEWIDGGFSQYECDCGTLCYLGCKKKLCKRIAYNGDATQCCIKQTLGLGEGLTCDPKYRNGYKTDDCNVYMTNYCKIGNNLFTPQCLRWFNQHRLTGTPILQEVCTKTENINRVECACITESNKINNLLKTAGSNANIPVECVDTYCLNPKALKTYDMFNNKCVNISCNNSDQQEVKTVLSLPNEFTKAFTQTCQLQPQAKTFNYTLLLEVLLAIVIFILLILLVRWIMKKYSSNKDKESDTTEKDNVVNESQTENNKEENIKE
jgi:hypothetical protein